METTTEPTIKHDARELQRRSSTGLDDRQQGLLMLVLVAGSDLDYCARVGETLQRDAHQVVMAANFDTCRQFKGYDSADAVIFSASSEDEVPEDLVREVHERHGTRVMVLVDDDRPEGTARYVEAGAECFAKPADLNELVRWVAPSGR